VKELNNVPTIKGTDRSPMESFIKTGEPGRGISTGKGISLGITVNMMAMKEKTIVIGGNMISVEAGKTLKRSLSISN
jgi:hypothetical protein